MEDFLELREDFVLVMQDQKPLLVVPLALLEDGDKIIIDAEKGTIDVDLDDQIFKTRKANGSLKNLI